MEQEIEMSSYKESRELETVYTSLVSFYKEKYPDISSTLREPARDEDLVVLEKVIGQQLPAEFKRLYKLANGQDDTNNPLFQNGYQFMSVEEIINTWRMMKELYDAEPDFRAIYDRSGVIVDTWWQPQWVPFGYMITGDHFCIDLSPGDKGTSGQVIEFIHDDSVRYHLGSSLTNFIGELDSGLRSGKYFMHPEYEIISSED